MSLVLDISVTLAWIYEESTGPNLNAVFTQLAEYGAWVPSLWRLEVANVLEMGVRSGRSNAAFRDANLSDIALLPIQTDLETDKQAWSATLQLAIRHQLTLYDAAYLELSQRRNLPLATLDKELIQAAKLEGIPLLVQ